MSQVIAGWAGWKPPSYHIILQHPHILFSLGPNKLFIQLIEFDPQRSATCQELHTKHNLSVPRPGI